MDLLIKVLLFRLLIASIINAAPLTDNAGTSVIFRAHPTGWTCGDTATLALRISYSFETETTLGPVVTQIITDCQENCLNIPWCRSYSLEQLPQSVPDRSYTRTDSDYNEIDDLFATAGCNLYNQPHCQVAKWPGQDSSIMVYKVSSIFGYDLIEKKCQRAFESYMAGPPDLCSQICDYSPLCIGFNYKFADNLCLMINRQASQNSLACPSELLRSDAYMVFFAKKVQTFQPQLNDPLPQPYPGFFAHNGNCRGGVTANFEAVNITGNNGLAFAVAIRACPTCNTTIESCLNTCLGQRWCRGVSVFVGAQIDYSKPLCFLKSASCDPSRIEQNAVYRFFEKLTT